MKEDACERGLRRGWAHARRIGNKWQCVGFGVSSAIERSMVELEPWECLLEFCFCTVFKLFGDNSHGKV